MTGLQHEHGDMNVMWNVHLLKPEFTLTGTRQRTHHDLTQNLMESSKKDATNIGRLPGTCSTVAKKHQTIFAA